MDKSTLPSSSSENPTFIKLKNDTVINEKHIRWIKKLHDCLYICAKSTGCSNTSSTYYGNFDGTHKLCQSESFEIYNKLNNKYFEKE